jgi:ElaB/YqjD/DUF883 family membrane-anchored ribosome-binding protein
MTTTSTVSNNLRDAGKEAAHETALEASSDIQGNLETLRDELRHLAEQVGNIAANKGNAAWQRARPTVEGAVSSAQEKGRDAIDALRDVTDNFVEAIDKSIKNRPYATLALFAAVGFVLGATRRR